MLELNVRQTTSRHRSWWRAAIVVLLLGSPARGAPSGAEEDSAAPSDPQRKAELHGTVTWGLGDTNGNVYQFGESETTGDNAAFTLTGLAHPTERLHFVAQLHLDSTGEDEVDAIVDYAFAEWEISDALRLHAGRAKHPFGIYGEVPRLGTIRPFLLLPQSLYGPSGMVGRSYDGVSTTGLATFGDWELQYDVYVGVMKIEIDRPWLALVDSSLAVSRDEVSEIGEVAGARVSFSTPSRLNFGLSAYDGEQEAGAGGRVPGGAHRVVGAHLDYTGSRWWIRGEAARHRHLAALTLDGAYLEVAVRTTDTWQLAWRYDYADVDIVGFRPIERAPSLWEHEDLGFAVSYWLRSQLVIRLEVHEVEGNRFAVPPDLGDVLQSGSLDSQTRLVQAGVQFSF